MTDALDFKVFFVFQSVLFLSELLCSFEKQKGRLVTLSHSGSEWRTAKEYRVQTEAPVSRSMMCWPLCDSQVLIGAYDSSYLELFNVKSTQTHVSAAAASLSKKSTRGSKR